MVQKIEKLTPEQEAVCAEVVKEYVGILDRPDPVFDKPTARGVTLADIDGFRGSLDAKMSEKDRVAKTMAWLTDHPDQVSADAKTKILAWLDVVYKGESQDTPHVAIVDSPKAALALANLLIHGSRVTSLDHSGLADAGWVSYSDAMLRIGAQTEEEAAPSMKLKAYLRMVFDSILLGPGPSSTVGCAIVVRHAKFYKRDSEGQLHCKDGPTIEWCDGEKAYFWHSVQVPEKLIMAPETYTADEYRAITQTEVRRAFGERYGWNAVVELIGAEVKNEWKDDKTGLEYALLRSPTGEQWIRKLSPALQNNAQPVYFEPVHEELRTAQAARKWQAVPSMRPDECERNPVLVYGVET